MLAEAAETAPAIEQAANAAQRFVKNAGTFKANMALVHNQAAATFLQSGVMATTPTIEVDDVKAELGPYLSQGNNLDVLQELYQGFTTSKHLNWKRAVTEYKAVESEATDHVIQQFKKEWTPRGGTNFVPLKIQELPPQGRLRHQPCRSRRKLVVPFIRRVADSRPDADHPLHHRQGPAPEDRRGHGVHHGKAKFVEGSEKTEETMNGIETQLVEAKKTLDKHIHFYADAKNLLEATDAEVLAMIDDFVASIAPLYKSKQMPVFMSAGRVPQIQAGLQGEVG